MNKIRLSKSSISQHEKDAVITVLDKEFLGMGDEVNLFEQDLKTYLNTSRSVVCVSTGTSALHLSLSALQISPGDEVLVPSLTYIATYQAISAVGATPISCEIDPLTLFIDHNDARQKITKKTKVIIPVLYASSAKGLEGIYTLAHEFNLRVIEDAAQAFGSLYEDLTAVGTKGDIICFSFDGIKNITSGEGGAIVSSDQNIIDHVKDARLLAVEKDTDNRYTAQRSWDFDVKEQGFRYHMSNIMAAIGRVQLTRINDFKAKRQEIASRYLRGLKAVQAVTCLELNYEQIIPHIFVIKAKRRDNLREYLLSHNIECGIHYKPNHLLTKYQSAEPLPITEAVYESILTLPCHFDLTEEDQSRVIETIKAFYE
ncbi:MAG TPA: DegT/DnrJ/EryC1/StrS family aminotransferase [Sulfuricurvum sp.]|nr:MAG: aminotransferase [Campylobacterales bacterium 16-40-21]OZA02292.1 MAG: aminotransferase [Sulfuricurvum sp. 17-40-25]HQS67299.1 DegT/DnrJ/EryC1/StrS family aminotransferase [Sulfuricurvum sp.]HQT36681.1 DegT/DnrJ/EryC1/StrS family aminotransferase [Sulfuricurvum sp.]